MKDFSTRLLKIALISAIILIVLVIIFISYHYVIPALTGTIHFLTPILLPFILALAFAELIDPLVDCVEKRFKIGRGFAVLIVLTVLFGGLITGIIWILTRLAIELVRLSRYLPELSNNLTGYLLEVFNRISDFYFSLGLSTDISKQLVDNISSNAEKMANQLFFVINS